MEERDGASLRLWSSVPSRANEASADGFESHNGIKSQSHVRSHTGVELPTGALAGNLTFYL